MTFAWTAARAAALSLFRPARVGILSMLRMAVTRTDLIKDWSTQCHRFEGFAMDPVKSQAPLSRMSCIVMPLNLTELLVWWNSLMIGSKRA